MLGRPRASRTTPSRNPATRSLPELLGKSRARQIPERFDRHEHLVFVQTLSPEQLVVGDLARDRKEKFEEGQHSHAARGSLGELVGGVEEGGRRAVEQTDSPATAVFRCYRRETLAAAPGESGFGPEVAGIEKPAAKGRSRNGKVVPCVEEPALRSPLLEEWNGLLQPSERDPPDLHSRPLQPVERECCGEDLACQAEASAGQLEEIRMAVPGQPENPVGRMKEIERQDAPPESAVPEMVLPVSLGGDAPADRDQGIAGLRRQIPAVRCGYRVKPAERQSGFAFQDPVLRVETEYAVEVASLLHGRPRAEAGRSIGIAAPADSSGRVARELLDLAIPVGASDGFKAANRAVEAHEPSRFDGDPGT